MVATSYAEVVAVLGFFFVTLYFITEDLRPPWVGLRPSGPRKRNNNLADMKYPIGC